MALNFQILSMSPSKRKQRKTSPTINQEIANILMPTIFALPKVILETEGSIQKIQKGHFFITKKLRRAPII